ncbi:MAG: regulatory protein RecX [Clostridia bacterium]|nr:regulatory protein RecX [Clostridia bacterium]
MPDIPLEHKKAVNSALNILGYADNTEKKLREKLRHKGFDPASVDFAVGYVKDIGALKDSRFIEIELRRLAEKKLYGIRRITQELYVKGFSREDIASLDFDDIDFPALCAKRIEQIAHRYPDKRKLCAALMRYGYTSADVKLALEIINE